MCGIAGLVNFTGAPVDPATVVGMSDLLRHRGPDGEGLWIEGPVGLGHRRLAIIDVLGGRQPMTNEDQSVWLVYNGEIYNHQQLREDLERGGHRFRTRCDAETILHAYERDGEDVVDCLRGMFAFALWDRTRRRLLLARDRLGIKPLYYAMTERGLAFASEIKALFASGLIRPVVHEAVIPEFLATRYVSGPDTFFAGVQKVLPASVLTWTADQGVRSRQYWRVPDQAPDMGLPLGIAAANLRRQLGDAVRRHLMSDVPLGVFLSGGLDSTAIAALTARLTGDRIRTFSVGFREQAANELPFARVAASAIGSEHREVVVSAEQFFNALPQIVWQEDEPVAFTSSVPLYFVSQLARQHVKVVLTGEGADELFLGYNRYRVAHWNARIDEPYRKLVPLAVRDLVRATIRRLPGRYRRYLGRTMLALEPGVRARYFENFAVFPASLRDLVLCSSGSTPDPFRILESCFQSSRGDLLARLSRLDLQTYLHELLMKQDQMSMAASIESRVPFLDDTVIEHVSRLPTRHKLSGWRTKAVLRAAVEDLLPKPILTRRKMGFPVPLGRWLRGPGIPVLEEFVTGSRTRARGRFHEAALRQLVDEHVGGRADHSERLWLLITLELWQRLFTDGEAVNEIMRPVWRRQGASHARAVGQDGRALAAEHWRPTPQFPDSVRTR